MTIASGSKWHCKHCFKSFGRKGDLTRHERLHSGIKDHLCTTCGKRFAQFTALKTHQNTHTRAKPYKCGLFACKASFGDPSSCARHRKETHGGVPSYKCPVSGCSSSIKRRAAFKNHLKKHGLDPSTILSESVERCINQPSALPNQFIPMKEEEQMTLYTLDEHYEVKPALTMPMTYSSVPPYADYTSCSPAPTFDGQLQAVQQTPVFGITNPNPGFYLTPSPQSEASSLSCSPSPMPSTPVLLPSATAYLDDIEVQLNSSYMTDLSQDWMPSLSDWQGYILDASQENLKAYA